MCNLDIWPTLNKALPATAQSAHLCQFHTLLQFLRTIPNTTRSPKMVDEMPSLSVRITDCDSYTNGRLSGRLKSGALITAFSALQQANQSRGLARIRVDIRCCHGMLSVLDRYQIANRIATFLLSNTRLAILCRPDQILRDRFWETAMTNCGIDGALFTNPTSATQWLLDSRNTALAVLDSWLQSNALRNSNWQRAATFEQAYERMEMSLKGSRYQERRRARPAKRDCPVGVKPACND